MITRSVTPLSNPQPAPDWRGQFETFFGADRSATLSFQRDGGSEPLSPDYLPEMADCRGY